MTGTRTGATASRGPCSRSWDFAGGRPIPPGLPDDQRHRLVEIERRFAVHLAAHVLAPSTLGYGLADSPAGMLAWILERWMNWSDDGGDIYTVFTRDDLLTHATIYWTGNAIASSIRTYANNNRHPWAPSHDRTPVIEAPTGITFVDYENPPGINSPEERIESFLASDRAAWYNHVNIAAHPHGGHFIPGRSRNNGPPTWSRPSSRRGDRARRRRRTLNRAVQPSSPRWSRRPRARKPSSTCRQDRNRNPGHAIRRGPAPRDRRAPGAGLARRDGSRRHPT